MPMKPIGPPSDTAAPVASEALRNASRCARHDLHALRGRGFSSPTLNRFKRPRQDGERAKRDNDERQRGDDRRSSSPTSRSPIIQRIARSASAKSARYCTNRISAEKNAFSVTPASKQHVRRQAASLRRGASA